MEAEKPGDLMILEAEVAVAGSEDMSLVGQGGVVCCQVIDDCFTGWWCGWGSGKGGHVGFGSETKNAGI